MNDDVGDDVRLFLRESIESYEELEVLLLLYREPLGSWTGPLLSARLHLDRPIVDGTLIALCNRRLVERFFIEGAQCHRLPAAVARSETLERLARVYANNAVEIVKLMSAHSIERIRTAALRTFADAFLFRKDKKDG